MPIPKGTFAVVPLHNANFITGRFCRDVENGVIQINAEDFPCFLYPEDSYNPDNVEEGLLRGEFLRSVYISCFSMTCDLLLNICRFSVAYIQDLGRRQRRLLVLQLDAHRRPNSIT